MFSREVMSKSPPTTNGPDRSPTLAPIPWMALSSAAPVVAGAVAVVAGTPATFYLAALMFGVTLIIVLLLPSAKGSTPTPRFAAR